VLFTSAKDDLFAISQTAAMPLKKDISNVTPFAQNGHSGPGEQETGINSHSSESDALDMVIVGAGFVSHSLRYLPLDRICADIASPDDRPGCTCYIN